MYSSPTFILDLWKAIYQNTKPKLKLLCNAKRDFLKRLVHLNFTYLVLDYQWLNFRNVYIQKNI